MWERQDGERDFSNDIQEARKLYFPVLRDWLYRRQDAIDNINEVMDEIRAELYWPNSMHSHVAESLVLWQVSGLVEAPTFRAYDAWIDIVVFLSCFLM